MINPTDLNMDNTANDTPLLTEMESPVEKRRKPAERRSLRNIFSASISPPATGAENPSAVGSITIPSVYASAADRRLEQIRQQKTQLSKEERNILETREKSSKETIRKLKLRLAQAKRSAQETRKAQTIRQTQLNQQNNALEHQIRELLSKNAELEELLIQGTANDTDKSNDVLNKVTELREKFMKSSAPSQRELFFKTSELQEAKIKIHELETEKITLRKKIQDFVPTNVRIQDLENKLKLATDMIVSLGGTVTEEMSLTEETSPHVLDDVVKIESDVLHIEYEKLSPRVAPEAMNGNGLKRSRSQSVCSNYNDDLIHVSDGEESSSSLHIYEEDENSSMRGQSEATTNRIWVGKFYVHPSNTTFFQIDWDSQYARRGRVFVCKGCKAQGRARAQIEDHVWTKHFQGNYECPICNRQLKWRYEIKKHMKTVHCTF